jgi:putative endonuclease
LRALGFSGEQIAAEYLISQGYELLAKNYTRRPGEIDIIARDKKVLAFIEVKYYKVNSLRNLREAVPPAKQRRIIRAAEHYLQERRITDSYVRFDAVLITRQKQAAPKIVLIKDAFRA